MIVASFTYEESRAHGVYSPRECGVEGELSYKSDGEVRLRPNF